MFPNSVNLEPARGILIDPIMVAADILQKLENKDLFYKEFKQKKYYSNSRSSEAFKYAQDYTQLR
jgi:hypothetical protein